MILIVYHLNELTMKLIDDYQQLVAFFIRIFLMALFSLPLPRRYYFNDKNGT
ncbi:MAG TPA: hypothetical protein H9980_05560 [Candidatus Erysipelatoclostridium merdavium]|uniref:Uncharacterized protein n=1 Tax=Candidatus Erysipelatoclostridium merdavium TaxID=2838566 RepID=A0A9D1XLT1_9FIRM|nr:hypothetical protein [Thomasclavelia sp.]HIX81426.1 hypothetical protein [Candidatus Erysipelatoclostridium merdavium]